MTDESTDETVESIQIEVPLDAVTGEAARQLREAGYDIDSIALQGAQPSVDDAILTAFQQSKYNQN